MTSDAAGGELISGRVSGDAHGKGGGAQSSLSDAWTHQDPAHSRGLSTLVWG